jgi:sugar lactone lactonase YvrE
MKTSTCILLTLLAASAAHAQIITTVAGNGGRGYTGDGGPATQATLAPNGVAVDAGGNIYICDVENFRIRKISPDGVITTVAGTGQIGNPYENIDGRQATTVGLQSPGSIAVDGAGNLYIAEVSVLRKVDTAGVMTTLLSMGDPVSENVPYRRAGTIAVTDVAADAAGNVYYAEPTVGRVRRIDTQGMVSTVAGTYSFGPAFGGDGGKATSASMTFPKSLAVDGSGNLYIADTGNKRIRKVTADGIISSIADSIDDITGLAVDGSGNVFFADNRTATIRQIDGSGMVKIVAGQERNSGFAGDDGPATAALIDAPKGLAVDGAGNLYVVDSNNSRIRKIAFGAGQ